MSAVHELMIREVLELLSDKGSGRDIEKLSFCCPECGGSELELTYTTTTQIVMDVACVYRDGSVKVGEIIDDGMDKFAYACAECGYMLGDDSGHPVTTGCDLAEWLDEESREHAGRSR